MTNSDIANYRLHNQQIGLKSLEKPGETVKWLCAAQAQDYYGALWTIGLRTKNSTEKDIEKAIADKTILRTWPMRGTLHFVASENAKWMLKLLTPRIISKAAGRHKQLEINDKVLSKSYKIFEKAFQKNKLLTRGELMKLLEGAGISTSNQRGYHILWTAAQESLICFGPINGKQQTFTLLDEWISVHKNLSRNESLAELAKRYFESRGPATLHDFVWWSGLTVADARKSIEMIKENLVEEIINEQTYWISSNAQSINNFKPSIYLLPGFDEYLLGYKDRSAVLDIEHSKKIVPWSNGMFLSTVIKEGQIIGTWKRTLKKHSVDIKINLFNSINKKEKLLLKNAVEDYGKFLNMTAKLLNDE
jgi:hypothetical protein